MLLDIDLYYFVDKNSIILLFRSHTNIFCMNNVTKQTIKKRNKIKI